MRPTQGTFVALLRGINVGGKNLLPMKDTLSMFEKAGCSSVRSYIQSGNIVFVAPSAMARRIPALIGGAIESAFALRVPVLVRSRAEMTAIANDNPLLAAGADPTHLHVVFLAELPARTEAEGLDPNRSPPDAFVLAGREIYLSCPNGVARTKLSNAYFDSKLRTISTERNWRTVLKLADMAGR